MDRVVLAVSDVERLLAWRDQHVTEVRSNPAPLKAVEILFPHNGITIKGIRSGQTLKLHLNQNGQSKGNSVFAVKPDGMYAIVKNRMKLSQEDLQSALTVYCSLMALMAHGRIEATPVNGCRPSSSYRPHQKAQHTASRRITYILKSTEGQLQVAPRGSHASPSGIFTVRGHYRHYKSGKIVWVAEYKKGTGKKKPKLYKLGGKV